MMKLEAYKFSVFNILEKMTTEAAQAVAQEVKSNVITLAGSAEIICDFMEFGINMILFQRDIYPNEDFKQVQKYGRPLYLTENEKLREYLKNILTGLKVMLEKDECHKVSLGHRYLDKKFCSKQK